MQQWEEVCEAALQSLCRRLWHPLSLELTVWAASVRGRGCAELSEHQVLQTGTQLLLPGVGSLD